MQIFPPNYRGVKSFYTNSNQTVTSNWQEIEREDNQFVFQETSITNIQ